MKFKQLINHAEGKPINPTVKNPNGGNRLARRTNLAEAPSIKNHTIEVRLADWNRK